MSLIPCPVGRCKVLVGHVSVLTTTGDGPDDIANLSCGCQITRGDWARAIAPHQEQAREHVEQMTEATRLATVGTMLARLVELATPEEITARLEELTEADDSEDADPALEKV